MSLPAPQIVSPWWLLRHELRLSWRDFQSMLTAGERKRFPVAIMVLAGIAIALHLPALAIVRRYAFAGIDPDGKTLFSVSMIIALYLSLLLSQAMETVTRTLYSRGDLDLVLSSPVSPARLFAVRIGTNALLTAMMAVVLISPFVDGLAATGGPRWLAAYGVAASAGLIAGAVAVAITVGLFRLLGPRRTRVVAQVVAAVIGAAFALGLQISAILYYGNITRTAFSPPPAVLTGLPGDASPLWLPARAVLGDFPALALVVIVALAVLALVTAAFAPSLGEHSLAATEIAASTGHNRARRRAFRVSSAASALRRKEWLLLRRDPWLVSQTLTQLLYLIPPALLLMKNFGTSSGAFVVVAMVLVSVGGQLGGALAWLAISGEDAPDLVRAAPVAPFAVTRAKVEAVMGAVAVMLAPLLLVFAFIAPIDALAATVGIACAAASTIRIQLWFRSQAKRNHFRRRHTSSRIATFAEALVSFSWAAAAGLAATGTWLAAISAGLALVILVGVRSVSPRLADA
jgi:ABC-2 type transport system permease protein